MKIRIFILLLTIAANSIMIFAESGKCGDAVIWTYTDGVLTINGQGKMYDYDHPPYGNCTPWFNKRNEILSVVIKDGVSRIGSSAFEGLSKVTTITIPNSVTSIGDNAISCASLTNVTFPNSVADIGGYVFYGCENLNKPIYNSHIFAYMPTSYTGKYSIPDGIETIAIGAFYRCANVESITIPNSVINICMHAFRDCSSLTDIKIPSSVTNIEDDAFQNCTGLPIINNIRYADTYLVEVVDKTLTNYIIKSDAKWIGRSAFYSCSNLKSIIIPSKITYISAGAFGDCKNLEKVTLQSNAIVSKDYAIKSSDIVNLFEYAKDFILGDNVTSIGKYAFTGSNLTSIIIPNSVTSIGDWAFFGCKKIVAIDIPNSVTNIGIYAFAECSNLILATLGSKVIGEYAFKDCSGLASVTIGNSVTSIGNSAFYGCKSLASVTIGNSVKSIGNSAFYGCKSLTSINIPNSVTSIGDYAFRYCSGLPIIDSIRYADTYLVEAVDKSLSSYAIKEETRFIGGAAFSGCKNLTSITIPNSVTSIGGAAFSGCTSLRSITIPNSVTSIEGRAFYECHNLKTITLPHSMKSIGGEAFYECYNLKTITLPHSVKSIGEYAFGGCSGLTSMKCFAIIPPELGSNAFNGVEYSHIQLYVPIESIDAYKAANQWKYFKNILPIYAGYTETTDVITTTTYNSVDVSWPEVDGAYTYELVIKDKEGNIVCTLIFDAEGRLKSIVFNAPARDDAPQQTQTAGFSFTITGLEAGTEYYLTITVKNENGQELDKKNVTFHTNWPNGIEDVHFNSCEAVKVLNDGKVYILRGDKTYTSTGQEVK